MTFEYWNASKTYTNWLLLVDIVFVVIFTIEAVLKIQAYYFSNYINDSWNAFDFVIVIIGWISMLPSVSVGLNVLRIFRICRIGRAFRLVKRAQSLQLLF